MLSEYLQFDTI